jgi:PKD domain
VRRRYVGGVLRRIIPLSLVLSAVFAASAEANTTLRVNAATGSDTGNCQAAPCKTLTYAIAQGRLVPDLITIDASAGTYTEDLSLGAVDSGLTIVGAGSGSDPTTDTVVTGVAGNPGINATTAGDASSLTLEHLRLVTPSGDDEEAIDGGATDVDLDDVVIDAVSPVAAVVDEGDLSVVGGSLSNTDPSAGPLLDTGNGAVTLTDTPITFAGGSPAILGQSASLTGSPMTLTNTTANAPAVIGEDGPVSLVGSPIDVKGNGGAIQAPGAITVTNSQLTLEGTGGSAPAIDAEGPFASVSVTGSPIVVDGPVSAIAATSDPAVLSNVQITLNDAANPSPALMLAARGSSLSHVTISGTWTGAAIQNSGSLAITDSSLTSGPASTKSVIDLTNGGTSGHTVSVVRSTIKEQPSTVPVISASNVDAAVDSSELLGGSAGVAFTATGGDAQTLTLASSTIDAGTLGIRDATPISSVEAVTDNTAGSAALVNVEGSILVEPPTTSRSGTNGTANVNCVYTEVPATTEVASATVGTINCGDTNGNTSTASLSSIFANPASGYALNPSWNGVDSVPASAFSFPAPFTDSSTDLLGNPRVINGVGTCTPGLRDKGAIELEGHSGVVPAPTISGPASTFTGARNAYSVKSPNVPSSVSLSDSWTSSDHGSGSGASFSHKFARAGRFTVSVTVSGATDCVGHASKTVTVTGTDTITHLAVSPKKLKTKATISYRASAAATTTLTIELKTNKGYNVVARLTHHDKTGTVKVTLLRGKLKAGVYRVVAQSKNGAGKGKAVSAAFTVGS